MNKNFLFGIAIGCAAMAVGYIFNKTEKKYITVDEGSDENGEPIVGQKEVEEPVITKEKVKETVSKAFDYICKNRDKVEAIGAVVSLLTGFVKLCNSINMAISQRERASREDQTWSMLGRLIDEVDAVTA